MPAGELVVEPVTINSDIHMCILEAKGLVKSFRRRRVVNGISLRVETGEIIGLLGVNGAGKTTLMQTISGLLPLTEGSVIFDGENISETPPHRRVELGLALVPEGRLIFPEFTVEENLRIGGKIFTQSVEKETK